MVKTSKRNWLILAAFLPIAAACTTPGPVGAAGGVTVLQSADLPAPQRADLTHTSREYYLGPLDKVEIDVYGIPDLRREVQVDAGGRVSFPFAGVVEASGRTTGELATAIEERLRGTVRDPRVTVNLKETVSQTVTVDGQVVNPGAYPVSGRMTLERAVARAGGTSEFARLNDVVIFRNVGGQRYAGLYNLQAIRRGNYPDPEIYPNDVVIVGDSHARRLFRDLLNAAPLLTTPLIILTQNSN